MPDASTPLPTPRKPKRYDYRGSTCPTHANRCAERRERGTLGKYECVFCANAATAADLLAPAACPPDCEGCALYASLGIDHDAPQALQPAPPPAAEPSPPPAPMPADPAAEGRLLTLPSGWRATREPEANNDENYAYVTGQPVWGPHWSGWSYSNRAPFGVADGFAPTMLQAMCAALGLKVQHHDGDGIASARTTVSGDGIGCSYIVGVGDDCARAALEAYHAQQQAPAIRAEADEMRAAARELTAPMRASDKHAGIRAPGCKCWTLPSGARQATRWCELPGHAAEWRTFAELQATADAHADGSPRAGCAVCASSPELDRRERGL